MIAELKPTSRENWRTVRFGDVVRNVDSSVKNPLERGIERFVGLEHLDPESLHVKRWGNVADGTSFTRKFERGQVLFGKRRAYQRKAAVADFDGICSGDILVFEPKTDELLPELLPFVVQSDGFFEHALGTSAGSLSPRTKWSDMARYEFALPPKDEQRRIAEILWAAVSEVQKFIELEKSIENYETILSAELLNSSTFDSKQIKFETSILGKVLLYASDGPFGSNLKTEHYSTSGARVVRLQNISEGEFNDDDKAYISTEYFKKLSRYEVKSGDIIVAGLGDETHPVGRVCQVSSELGSAINKADCFCLRVNPSIIEPDYLFRFLNSTNARSQIRQLTQGTTRFRINVSNLKTISIPIPDRKKQVEICEILKTVENTKFESRTAIKVKKNLLSVLKVRFLNKR